MSLIKVAALWKHKSAKGEFWSGKLGDAQIIVYANKKKTQDKQPDFNVFISEPYKKQGESKTEPEKDTRPIAFQGEPEQDNIPF